MKLTDLDPHFLRQRDKQTFVATDDLHEAVALQLRCPCCHWAFRHNHQAVHRVTVWRPRAGWDFGGSGYGDLSFIAGRGDVVAVTPSCGAPFTVRAGKVDF